MKSLLCHFLVFVIVLQASTRLLLVASYEWNKNYISQNLCQNQAKGILDCEGKCFLTKQLKKENQKEQSTKSSLKEKYELFFSEAFHFPEKAVSTLSRESFTPYLIKLDKHFLDTLYHPPC